MSVPTQEDTQYKARIRVRALSDMSILLYIVFIALLLFSLVLFIDCAASSDHTIVEIRFGRISLVDVRFGTNLVETMHYHRDHLVLIGLVYIVLGALPGLAFLSFKHFYKRTVKLTRNWVFIIKESLLGNTPSVTRISISQLDNIIVKKEFFLNDETLLLRSSGVTVRIHCVTNAHDFAHLAVHYYAQKNGNRDILIENGHGSDRDPSQYAPPHDSPSI